MITPTHVIVANAGDSRGVMVVQKADRDSLDDSLDSLPHFVVEPMSYDHKPTNDEETARINAAGGYVSMRRVNGDLAVSRSLGDFGFKKNANKEPKLQMVSAFPDIKIMGRGQMEFLLLCCDGVWDVMDNEAAGELVRQLVLDKYAGEPLSAVMERLLDTCLAKGSRDNMSGVIIVDTANLKLGECEKPEGDAQETPDEAAPNETPDDTQTRLVHAD